MNVRLDKDAVAAILSEWGCRHMETMMNTNERLKIVDAHPGPEADGAWTITFEPDSSANQQ